MIKTTKQLKEYLDADNKLQGFYLNGDEYYFASYETHEEFWNELHEFMHNGENNNITAIVISEEDTDEHYKGEEISISFEDRNSQIINNK